MLYQIFISKTKALLNKNLYQSSKSKIFINKLRLQSSITGTPKEPLDFSKNFYIEKDNEPLVLAKENAHPYDLKINFDENSHSYTFDGIDMKSSVSEVYYNSGQFQLYQISNHKYYYMNHLISFFF